MANDFSGDANCVALWKVDNGALTTDSKGGNTLTDNNTIGTDTVDFKEGDASAEFANANECFSITDANLDAGFPFKDGDTNKKVSVCFWLKFDTLPSVLGQSDFPWSKYDAGASKRSFAIRIQEATDVLSLILGYNGGASFESSTDFGTTFSNSIWYHVGVTWQDSDKAYVMRIWDDNASDFLDSDITDNFTNNINIEDALMLINNISSVADSNYGDCRMDEVVVFKDVLSAGEIDQIRNGTFGAVGVDNTPAILMHLAKMRRAS